MKKRIIILALLLGAALAGCGNAAQNPAKNAPQNAARDSVQDPAVAENEAPAIAEAAVCTVSIDCTVVLDKLDELPEQVREVIPKEGVMLESVEVEYTPGDTVFDILKRAVLSQGLHMEHQTTPGLNTAYIQGIGNLYEFDCGELSGWRYMVDGQYPAFGCSSYELKGGESICWRYTCDLGDDIGAAGIDQ